MTQVDEVRAAADIVKVVGDYVKLRKAGANFMGLCPFHQEKTPSFAVHPTKQIFHCFGCGVGGDVFKFVMLVENLAFPEALRRVAEKVGVVLRETFRDEAADAHAHQRAALYKIHEAAAKFFAAQLGATAEGRTARAYLADRGLGDEAVGRFRLGYAPGEGQALARALLDAGFSPEALERSGLVLRDVEGQRYFDRFRRRIIFPIGNESGKVVAFGGRTLGDDQPKYLNSPETPIYTKGRVLYHLDRAGSAIRKLDYAILVEGYMDCIAVASAGIDNVVATCGTSLTEGQIRLLSRYSRRVVVNYDPDSAGVAATQRSLDLLLEEGFEAKVLALPAGLDPDSFIRRQGSAAYRERLSAAPTYLDYLTERAAAQHDLSRPEGKVAAANAVLPYLVKIPNPMLRAELTNRLAERLRLEERLLREELKRAAGEGRRDVRLRPEVADVKVTPAEKQLLRAFMESEDLADEFLGRLVEEGNCEGLAMEHVFRHLLEARRRPEKFEVSRIDEWAGTETARLVYESVFEGGEVPERDQVLACYRALQIRKLDRQREKLQTVIRGAEREQDQKRVTEMLEAKAKLDKEIAELKGWRKFPAQEETR
jgi:DNA primase